MIPLLCYICLNTYPIMWYNPNHIFYKWLKVCLSCYSLFVCPYVSHTGWVTQCFIHFHLSSHIHSPPRGLLSVCCLQSIVSFQGRFNAMQKFANQLFWSTAYQTGLSSSSVRPVSLFVRFFCHSSSGWQERCTSDPSSFSWLFSSIITHKTHVNQATCLLLSSIWWSQRWQVNTYKYNFEILL